MEYLQQPMLGEPSECDDTCALALPEPLYCPFLSCLHILVVVPATRTNHPVATLISPLSTRSSPSHETCSAYVKEGYLGSIVNAASYGKFCDSAVVKVLPYHRVQIARRELTRRAGCGIFP